MPKKNNNNKNKACCLSTSNYELGLISKPNKRKLGYGVHGCVYFPNNVWLTKICSQKDMASHVIVGSTTTYYMVVTYHDARTNTWDVISFCEQIFVNQVLLILSHHRVANLSISNLI